LGHDADDLLFGVVSDRGLGICGRHRRTLRRTLKRCILIHPSRRDRWSLKSNTKAWAGAYGELYERKLLVELIERRIEEDQRQERERRRGVFLPG
jgi:hypothetical protein